MRWLADIFNPQKLIKVLAFVMVCVVFSVNCNVYAEDTPEPKQTEEGNTPNVKEPDFYKDAKVQKSKSRTGEVVEWVSVKNAHEYVKQNTDYLTKVVLDENTSSEDVAYLLKRYPTTLGDFDGMDAYQEERVLDKLDDMKDDGLINDAQYKAARRKTSLGFDEHYKQSMRQTIVVGKGNVDKFDPSKHTKDPAYHAARNRSARDQKDGIFTEEETKQRNQDYIDDGLAKKNVVESLDKKCDVAAMRQQYQGTADNPKCYSCVIVKTLIETFMSACATAYDITAEAGVKILVLGALLWMAFFVMKNVSSMANVEPGAMVNTLAVFLFKVMVAYIFITSGLGVLVTYFVNPFLTAGADFGMALMSTTSEISGAVSPSYAVKVATVTAEGGKEATEIVSADVLNKIMLFTQNLDRNVSTNLVIGHAVTCHSMNAGAWDLKILKIVNVWLWACGAAIWFVGFMLTLGICFYLLDISFKLGFAIMVLPIVIGLWPFNITKGKVTAIFSIVLKSGATFAFLALTTTYALVLINNAFRDIPTLLAKIDAGETQWVSDTFDISGPYFIIILFAYLYSMKLIAATVEDYVDKYFADNVFGSASPMHQMSTQMVDFAKQQALGAAKSVGTKAKDAIKEKADEKLHSAAKFIKSLYKGKSGGGSGSSSGGASGAVKNSGKAIKAGGATAEKTGAAVEQGGKAAEQGGKATAAGGKGMMSSGKGMMSSGLALSGTGVGAIIGVPMMIAGAAVTAAGAGTYAAGKAVEVSGKVAQKAGKAIKKGGKAMKKVGNKMEKAGEKMQRIGNRMKFGRDNPDGETPPPPPAPAPDSNSGSQPAEETPPPAPAEPTPPQPAPSPDNK